MTRSPADLPLKVTSSRTWGTAISGAGDLAFGYGSGSGNVTEGMRITYQGEVGIGTNSTGGNKLYVYGGGVRVDSNGSNADGSYLNLRHANNNTADVISTIFFCNFKLSSICRNRH